MQLPDSSDVRAFLRRTLHPRTKLGKTTLWFGYLTVALFILRLIFHSASGSFLGGWSTFIAVIFLICALLMSLRWLRRIMMWRVRNRLIVTYVFIGVIPIVLLIGMGIIASYLFAGQFATYVAMSDLQSELQHLEGTNRSMASQFRTLAKAGRLTPEFAAEIASASDETFRHRSVSVWDGEQGFVLSASTRVTQQGPVKPPSWLKDDFAGFVLDDHRLQIRVVKRVQEGAHRLTVISNLPITPDLLKHATLELGSITVYFPDVEKAQAAATPGSAKGGPQPAVNQKRVTVGIGNSNFNVADGSEATLEAGTLPPATGFFDLHFPWGTSFDFVDWPSGKSEGGLLAVDTRPSLLYSTLFATLGEQSEAAKEVLIGIAIFLGIIELVALFIGVRLTRSMTKSIAELYRATEYINRGELQHRIQVRNRDQMAALEQSFNSMTTSLANLIAEQKEKQRMESELAIAHEVQALLFPADLSGLPSLEVHGVCKPARTVSGDYYDFIPLSAQRLMLAVGDISGKGISAALLMATVHAFVRAYSLEPEKALASLALSAGGSQGNVIATRGNGYDSDSLSPAFLMSTLNYQLYRSTPPEKYATMFLACYDAISGSLTYSNAGHLPPLVLSLDGTVRRSETSGTVVGLFDGMTYGESSVRMQPGDIFVAYSDGITEPENEFGEFGEERLIELILQHRNESLSRISETVTGAVSDWIAGGEQPDDVTLVLARAR
jgi:sigma-B regulation protein RsbU (phosphoserine phosphatase)